jgi:hypothetical protein
MMTEPKKTAVKKHFIHHRRGMRASIFLLMMDWLSVLLSPTFTTKITRNLRHTPDCHFNSNSY